jgi:ankyrin repeat protein
MDRDDTCVSRAILDNELEILQVLINAKADLNFAIRCDRTPIITAIRCNNLPALKLVVEGGADPCLVDQYGRTPEGYLSNDTSPELCGYFKPVVTMHSKKKSST